MRNERWDLCQEHMPLSQKIKRLDLPSEIMTLVEQEVSTFHSFTPFYMKEKYIHGQSEMMIRFQGNKVGITDQGEKMGESELISARCQALASVIGALWKRGFHDIMQDLDIIVPVSFSDTVSSPRQEIPSLTFCKEVGSNNILIPSVNNLLGYAEMEHISMVDRPLLSKEDKMCFVGSLTNIHWNDMGMQYNQRLQLANMVGKSPNLVCKLNKPKNYDNKKFREVEQEVFSHFPDIRATNSLITSDDKVDLETQLKYKFQICIDGHVSAWARLPWQLISHSVPIKVRNPDFNFMEWYYPLLNMSRHCIETSMDRLEETFEYLVQYPEVQQEIDQAGRDFVTKYINTDLAQRIFLYTLLLISEHQPVYMDVLTEE